MKKLQKILVGLVVLVSFGITDLNAQCSGHTACAPENAELYAIRFHADWCGGCKKLAEPFKEFKSSLGDKKVAVMTFNLTDDNTKMEAKKMAEELGISKLYEKNKKTGFVMLVDANTKEKLKVLTYRKSTNEMLTAVDEYLGR